MFSGGIIAAGGRPQNVANQEAMITDLEAISRRRELRTHESDLLAELLRLAASREWWRKRRRADQLARAEARLARLVAA